MRIPENLCMLLPEALKLRAIKHTMALIADSIGGPKCAPAQVSWHLRHLNPALLNRQGMSTHPKMDLSFVYADVVSFPLYCRVYIKHMQCGRVCLFGV